MMLAWLGAVCAFAQSPTLDEGAPLEPPEAATTQAPPTFAEQLQAAKGAWFRGERADAEASLQQLYLRLVSGEEVPLEVGGEVAIYLGEIAFVRGDLVAAEAAWSWLLQRDPDFPISPYQHPLEVVGWFEGVRSRLAAERIRAPAPKRPYPWWGFLPGGAPQFRQDQPVRGAVYLAAQTALAATSLGVWAHLAAANPDPGTPCAGGVGQSPLGWPCDTITTRVAREKYAVQWPATIGFYAVWGVSLLDGQARWQREVAAPSPSPTLPPVVLRGRF